MDAPAPFNCFSDQERRYINQWVSSLDDGAFEEQLQLQGGHNGCWQPSMAGSVHNSNSSTGSNISFVGMSYANQAAVQKPKQEVLSWEDGSMSISRPASDNQSFLPKARVGVMKTQPAAKNVDPQDHIMAERRRREKLSQRFIALSAIIPGLKKTDKASVLGDTIKYLKQMQERVKTLEEEARQKAMQSMVLVKKAHLLPGDEITSSDTDKSLPEVEAKVCDKSVLIRIHCEKRQGVVEQVLADIEKIHLTTVNTSVLSFGATSLHITIVAQMNPQFCKTIKDIVNTMFLSVQGCT